MSAWEPTEEKPLKGVSRCKKTDCAQHLHCFLKDRHRTTPEGTCLACGADLIDWPRLHRRDMRDVDHTIFSLKYEHIRHDFWCKVQLTARALAFARKHGRSGILREARKRVETKLLQPGRFANWGQTPFEDRGNAIHFAQHATATCCRRCIEVWHGIERQQVLTPEEVDYFAQLMLRYVVDRVPDLADGPSALGTDGPRRRTPHRAN
jgi:hypothetical protein